MIIVAGYTTVDLDRINMFELWATQEHLDTFRAQANPPDTGVQFIPGWIQEYLIERVRDPFSTDSTAPA